MSAEITELHGVVEQKFDGAGPVPGALVPQSTGGDGETERVKLGPEQGELEKKVNDFLGLLDGEQRGLLRDFVEQALKATDGEGGQADEVVSEVLNTEVLGKPDTISGENGSAIEIIVFEAVKGNLPEQKLGTVEVEEAIGNTSMEPDLHLDGNKKDVRGNDKEVSNDRIESPVEKSLDEIRDDLVKSLSKYQASRFLEIISQVELKKDDEEQPKSLLGLLLALFRMFMEAMNSENTEQEGNLISEGLNEESSLVGKSGENQDSLRQSENPVKKNKSLLTGTKELKEALTKRVNSLGGQQKSQRTYR